MKAAARGAATGAHRVPIIKLYGNLIVPIPDLLSDDALLALRDEVTRRVAREGASGVVIDVGAVETMDSYVTRVVRDLAVTAQLMGAHTVLAGVPVPVAITMVEMGFDLPGVATALDLERAMELLADLRARARLGLADDEETPHDDE